MKSLNPDPLEEDTPTQQEGWELCLQATLMGTGLVARFASFCFFRFSVSLLLLCRASVRAVCMPFKMLQSSLQTSC